MKPLTRAGSFLLLTLACWLPSVLGATEHPAGARVLRVKAVADEAFRDNSNWEKEIREHFLWADKEFRKLAGMGLQLVAVERWTTHESESMGLLLKELRLKADKGDADIVVGFTGHKPPEWTFAWRGEFVRIQLPFVAGVALPLGDRAVVRRGELKSETRHTLLHELAHLFGGVHVKEKSLLQTTTESTHFVLDSFNQRIFALTRQRDFNQDIRDLPPAELDQLVSLYRQAPLLHERDSDTHIRVAYIFLAAGQVESAVEEFQKAIEIEPRDSLSIVRDGIIPELEAYAEEHNLTPELRYTLGSAYYTVRDWHRAQRHLGPNCYPDPPHAPSCAELGATYIQAQAIPQAEEALKRALESDESLWDAHNNLGIVYTILKQPSEAVAHFNRAIELKPDKSNFHYNMGMAYLTMELLEPAADAFGRSLELKPKDEPSLIKLALTRSRQGDHKQARELIRDFEKRDTLPSNIIRDMAEIYFRAGDRDRAWKYLGFAKKGGFNVTELEQEMLAGAPKAKQVKTADLIQQAKAYYDQDRYDVARNLLDQALAQEPDKEQIHYWLGRVANAQNQPEEAARHLQRALQLNEKFPHTHLELGDLANDRKDYPAALRHLTRYLELDNSPASYAYYLVGSCHLELNNLAAAEENLKKAIQRHSNYGNAFFLLARVYQRQQRREEAIAEMNLAVESRSLWEPWRPEAHYTLGVLHQETRKYDQAWRHARVAQRLGHSSARNLLATLAKLAPDSPQAEAEAEEEPEAVEETPAGPASAPMSGQAYQITAAVVGDPPGTVRAGNPIRGRLRLVGGAEAPGNIAVSIKIGPAASPLWQYWLFASPQIRAGQGEKELVFEFMPPPSFSQSPGDYRGLLSVVTKLEVRLGGGPPKLPSLLSNEFEVSFRVVR